jgi:ubiquinone/menaquinone biosynthesis C-methylase UbiE
MLITAYNKYVLPRLLDRGMGRADFNEARKEVVNQATGTVLEIGFGSGYNLPFYKDIKKLYALDPSSELYTYATDRVSAAPFPVEYLKNSAENIPLEDTCIDTVVSTWSLCSIPDLPQALTEIKRVLKPDGRFVFVEHGQSPKRINSTVQKLVTHVTRHFTGNCHLDRKIDDYITHSGLIIESLEMLPEEGRPLMFSYQGVAVRKAD